jgi:hypothetical protein
LLKLATAIFPRFDHVGLLIPMPASRPRPRQPVTFLTEVLGKLTALPVFDNLLSKTANGKLFVVVGEVAQLEQLLTFMSETARLKAEQKIGLLEKLEALKHDQSAFAF